MPIQLSPYNRRNSKSHMHGHMYILHPVVKLHLIFFLGRNDFCVQFFVHFFIYHYKFLFLVFNILDHRIYYI